MPIYQLDERLIFPHPSRAEDGILAIGGDLSVARLVLAYQHGIFPWYNDDEPIIWHAPDPRFVLFPSQLKISKSMLQLIKSKKYTLSLNKNFKGVIHNCRNAKRKHQQGTWIHDEMEIAYIELHKAGFAHSIEVWNQGNELVGGLYGVNLGSIFYGESMFHKVSNASKLAFISLVKHFPFTMIDCQVFTAHLSSLGAEHISLEKFLKKIVKDSKKQNLINGNTNFTSS